MSNTTISPQEIKFVQSCVDDDRSKLFALSDQILSAEQRWNTIITDAGRGMLVGEFICHILQAVAQQNTCEAPRLVHIANSRRVAASNYKQQHRQSVNQYLQEQRVAGRALLVTEMVDTGRSLRRLGGYARDNNLQPDFAILTVGVDEEQKVRRKIRAKQPESVYFIYDKEGPSLACDTISQGIGYSLVPGKAEVPKSPAAWPWIGAFARKQYAGLADEYVQSRIK